tara:strand:+ start:1425 stop:1634 length:210 start_codon:yes stop_codon:yes gene_type:complete
MSRQVKNAEDDQQAKVNEPIQHVDPPYELVQKLQKLNQKCLHPRKLNLNETKLAVKELNISIVGNEKRT